MGARIAKAIWKKNKAGVLYTIKTCYKAMLIQILWLWCRCASQVVLVVKNSPANASDVRKLGEKTASYMSRKEVGTDPSPTALKRNQLFHRLVVQ